MSTQPLVKRIDWPSILLYATLVLMGLVNLYAVGNDSTTSSLFDLSQRHGLQLLWIAFSALVATGILLLDVRIFSAFAYPIYAGVLLLLLATLIYGAAVHGSRSWLQLGALRLQPSEFAKLATALALAKYMARHNFSLQNTKNLLAALTIIAIPVALILLQNDFGSALVFSAFIIPLYREGLHSAIPLLILYAILLFIAEILFPSEWIIAALALMALLALMLVTKRYRLTLRITIILLSSIGIIALLNLWGEWTLGRYAIILIPSAGLAIAALAIALFKRFTPGAAIAALFLCGALTAYSVEYVMDNVLETHHQRRIYDMLGVEDDPLGWGYNVNQSKIAIGSGGLLGKGFLKGTQTKYNFVPEQSTDFIFCTVGEEWGFIGSSLVIALFVTLLLRILRIAERQRTPFNRIYGYGVLGILLFHFAVNISMTLGLFPVIGIPLPFFSYGGSSLLAFTILLFVLVKLDTDRHFH